MIIVLCVIKNAPNNKNVKRKIVKCIFMPIAYFNKEFTLFYNNRIVRTHYYGTLIIDLISRSKERSHKVR